MQKLLAYKRLTNWIAAIAILFAAISGGIGQVFAKAADDSQLTAVCTSSGMKYVKVSDLASTEQSQDNPSNAADCPYCLFNHLSVALIQELVQFNHRPELQSDLAKAETIVFAGTEVRLPPSRAPPTLSC